MSGSIGSSIRRLRKESGMTQAELAKAVGVSVQAVSKWECGGTPDVTLLPAIADFFSISIDRLFGYADNGSASIEQLIQQALQRTSEDGRMRRAVELCWAVFKGLSGLPNVSELGFRASHDICEDDCTRCRLRFDEGICYASAAASAPSFFLLPDPDDGFENHLMKGDEYLGLFQALANPDLLRIIKFLYGRRPIPFTAEHLVGALGLGQEAVSRCLGQMARFGWVEEEEVEMESGSLKLYRPLTSEALLGFFYFAGEVLEARRLWYLNHLKRSVPVFGSGRRQTARPGASTEGGDD